VGQPHHDDLRLDAGCRPQHAPCDCTHIQISGAQSPAAVSSNPSPDASRVAALHAMPIGYFSAGLSLIDAAARLSGPSPPAWPQHARCSAVLRC
jgi:hypothetical protein